MAVFAVLVRSGSASRAAKVPPLFSYYREITAPGIPSIIAATCTPTVTVRDRNESQLVVRASGQFYLRAGDPLPCGQGD
jgi:hypothetical protein